MAQPKSESEASGESPRSRRSRARGAGSRRLGRRIAGGAVIVFLVYLIGVGVISVVPQVFWPEMAELDPAIGCEDGVRDLRTELLTFAGERVASAGGDPAALEAYFDRWDLRHRALEPRCQGDGHHAWTLLGRMRGRLESRLERFDAEEGALAREVDSTLARR